MNATPQRSRWKTPVIVTLIIMFDVALAAFFFPGWFTFKQSPAPPRPGLSAVEAPRIDERIVADLATIQAFHTKHWHQQLSTEVTKALQQLPSDDELDTIIADYSGLIDRQWRTGDALAREFIFRQCTAGMFACLIALVEAEQSEQDSSDAIELANQLQTPEVLEALADALWSDQSLRSLNAQHWPFERVKDAASTWGQQAASIIGEKKADTARKELRVILLESALPIVTDNTSRFSGITNIIVAVSVDPYAKSRFHSEELRAAAIAKARFRAQSAAVTISALGAAREQSLWEVHTVLLSLPPKNVTEFHDSFSGFWDSPKTTYDAFLSSEFKLVSAARFEKYVVDPSEWAKLGSTLSEVYKHANRTIENRIRDECAGDADRRYAPPGNLIVDGSTQFDTRMSSLPINAVVESGFLAASVALTAVDIALWCAPEPVFTKVAAGVVLCLDAVVTALSATWDTLWVTEALKLRTSTMATLIDGVVAQHLGAPSITQTTLLADETIISVPSAANAGSIPTLEHAIFNEWRTSIAKANLQP